MAKLVIEMYGQWMSIKTIPITKKIRDDILNRIPNDLSWRANYLSMIIQEPKMSVHQWSMTPSLTINIICRCVDHLLDEYEIELKILDNIMDKIENESYNDELFEKMTKARDYILSDIKGKEDETREYYYSSEKIANIHDEYKLKLKHVLNDVIEAVVLDSL